MKPARSIRPLPIAATWLSNDGGYRRHPRGTVLWFRSWGHDLAFFRAGAALVQAVLARHMAMPEENVRIIARDIGGSFGIKVTMMMKGPR